MSKGFRHVGRAEIPGGGQVTVQGNYAYVGHLDPPHGTSIIDVSNPKHPELCARCAVNVDGPGEERRFA